MATSIAAGKRVVLPKMTYAAPAPTPPGPSTPMAPITTSSMPSPLTSPAPSTVYAEVIVGGAAVDREAVGAVERGEVEGGGEACPAEDHVGLAGGGHGRTELAK